MRGLLNNQPSQSSPASVPTSTSVPTQPTSNLESPSTTSDPTNTGTTAQSLPSLISDVLNPSPVGNPTGTATTAAASMNPKRKPKSGASSSSADGVNNSNDNTDSNINGTSIYPTNKSQDETQSFELAPGLIAVMVILVLAIVAAIAICCYKIRQSQRRRRESWSEDILKNHAGSVGYSKGAGYGMYVGDGGFDKEKPDLWRKNLDLFHRE
ncbi:hypothetical protein BGX20_005271 [Mortierella sp. AD010]|nr:hypothetical protein BGX20_005271 [Mortierella sp. AD010]